MNRVNRRFLDRIRCWAVLVTLVLIAAIIVLADHGALPAFVYTLYDFPMGDKVGHFFLMGLLALGLDLLLPGQPKRGGFPWLLTGGRVAVALVILEEASQFFIRSRTFSFIDLIFSLLGILCADFLVRRWRIRLPK